MNKYFIIFLLFTLTLTVQASDFMDSTIIKGVVNNIDIEHKQVVVDDKIYPYSLKFGDVYFESIKKTKPIEKLLLHRKYYIEIYNGKKHNNSKRNNGIVIYIGKIKPII